MSDVTLNTLNAKLDALSNDLAEIKEDIKTMNGRQRNDHDRLTRLEERVNWRSGIHAALTLIASAIAAWLGIRS